MSEQEPLEADALEAPWHFWIITDILKDLALGLIYVVPVLFLLWAINSAPAAVIFVACAAPFVIGFAYALNLLGEHDEKDQNQV
jgi:hypothetical protein